MASGSSTANLPIPIWGQKAEKASGVRLAFAGLVREHGKALVAAMPEPAWSLHPQLEKDTIDIGDLPLCRVLVIKDAHYPWLLLVPRRPDIVEIIDLTEVEQAQLMTEVSRVARAERSHQMRQAQYRRARQSGTAASCACDRAPLQRCGMAASGLGRHAAASP